MDALRKAAAAASSGIKSLDGNLRPQASERAAQERAQHASAPPDALRRAAALMAPSATTAAPSPGGSGAPGSPASALLGQGSSNSASRFGTPATPGGRAPAAPSLMDAPAGGAGGAAAALEDVYGELSALRQSALASPSTPVQHLHAGGTHLDVSALADMLRIDLMSRRARPRAIGRRATRRRAQPFCNCAPPSRAARSQPARGACCGGARGPGRGAR